MTITPFDYQVDGIEFLALREAALLADDPGLGKTFQAIRAADLRQAKSVLTICPASVVGTWSAEVRKYREGDWEHFVTSYEGACNRHNALIMKRFWDILIIDEVHYLKSLTSKRTKGIYGFKDQDGLERNDAIIDRAKAVWVLSATPTPNNPSEWFSHLRALMPDQIRSKRTGKIWSSHQFLHYYCKQKKTDYGYTIVGARKEAELRSKLDGFMIRRRKSKVLEDLPPLRFGEIELDGDLNALPEEEVKIVEAALKRGGFDALREVAGHVAVLRRLTGLAKVPAMVNWTKDWLAGSGDAKIVLFAYHRDVIAGLAKGLGKHAVVLDGSVPTAKRQAIVDRFQTDPKVRVFIGQMTAAGVGVTLTAASQLVVIEPSWVPAEVAQATQRIHRIGQTEACLAQFALIPKSIDEDIQRAASRKMRMISAVID